MSSFSLETQSSTAAFSKIFVVVIYLKRDIRRINFDSRRFSVDLECGHRFFFFLSNLLQSTIENWWALMRILWISFQNSCCVSDADHFKFYRKWKKRFYWNCVVGMKTWTKVFFSTEPPATTTRFSDARSSLMPITLEKIFAERNNRIYQLFTYSVSCETQQDFEHEKVFFYFHERFFR